MDVTGRGRKRSRVICVIKFWYVGFTLLLPVWTYLANQNYSVEKQAYRSPRQWLQAMIQDRGVWFSGSGIKENN